jgi:cell division protein FtsZ
MRIVVVGVGGGGCKVVNRLLEAGPRGVECAAVGTDVQALHRSEAPTRISIGEKLTRGLGAGGNPSMGERAAEESAEALFEICSSADLVFVVAGMGGGTGTGAAPVVAEIAQGCGALTIGVVTKPFSFEGARRRQTAEQGLVRLKEKADTLVIIPCERLLQVVEKRTSIETAFMIVDDVLRQGIQGISELITEPGLINLDFADVKTIMSEAGSALMAIGRGSGEARAADAARMAISSPLLDVSMEGARGVLLNITGGADLTLNEINEAAEVIRQAADQEANIIFGAIVDPRMQDEVKLTVIAMDFATQSQPPDRPGGPRFPSWRPRDDPGRRRWRPPQDDSGGMPAGSREPRRPRPGSLSGAVELELPTSDNSEQAADG